MMNWAKNSLVLVVSVAVVLVVLEISLRLSEPKRVEPVSCRTFHPLLHLFFVPSTSCQFKTQEWNTTYNINSAGIRDQEYSLEKPAGIYRVLVTGDSFTEGFGVENNEAFVNKLEAYVNQTSDRQVEAINAGVSSWSPTTEYIFLKNFGLKFNPDLVIVVVTVSDFSDEYFYEREVANLGAETQLFTAPVAVAVETKTKTRLRDKLKMYNFLSIKIKTMLGRYNPIGGVHPLDIGKVEKDQMAVSRLDEPVGYQSSLDKMEQRLQQIADLLSSQKRKFLLVLLPHPHMVNGQEWAKGRSFFGFKKGVSYSRRGFDDLAVWDKMHGIDNLDLTPTLQIASASRRLYFDNDGHLNSEGHDIVAKALHTYLTPKFSSLSK